MNPGHRDMLFLPLGGCGEIGMNLNLYGHAGQWLMVDCGLTFESDPERPGSNRLEMPDPVFIANRAQQLAGIVVTHAHEDHLGALPYLWQQFRCPIYTTAFTRNVLLAKFRRMGVDAPVLTVRSAETLELGPFRVRWLPITHSTPETHALLIETPAGRALHTADWKLDSGPVVGAAFDAEPFRLLGGLGLDAVVCDSTNATREGSSVSESQLFENLLTLVRETEGRAVLSCFSSNIARLQTLGHVAHVSGRYLGLLGRSLENMVRCARAAGYLEQHFDTLSPFELGYLPPGEILAIATGSQGETGSALQRLAADRHPDIALAPGDHVIFSATTIPGNETAVARLLETLRAKGVRVSHGDEALRPLHASGHPCADELSQMYRWLQPALAIPVHGEARHMRRNAELARACGVPRQLCGSNGDLFDLLKGSRQAAAAPAGRLFWDEAKRSLQAVPAGSQAACELRNCT